MMAPRVTIEDLKRKIDGKEDIIILDVRNPTDYAASPVKILGAVRIPLDTLEQRLNELDPNKEVIAYCT